MGVHSQEESTPPVDFLVPIDQTFAAVFAALAPDEAGPQAGQGGTADGGADDQGGPGSAAGQGAGDQGAGGQPGPGAGDGGGAVQADGSAPATSAGAGEDGARSAAGAVAYAAIAPKLGEISVALETNTLEIHQAAALAEVREELGGYFDALRTHPRLLAGTQVPSLTGEGMEVLRDAADAREWQDAVKTLLAEEVRDRASRRAEDDRSTLEVLHGAVELFQNNPDLVPGTAEFDQELADTFAATLKPYEVRINDRLHGYSVPVQPLVNKFRSDLAAQRARAAATPPAAQGEKPAQTGQAAPGQAQAAPPAPSAAPSARGPQAGIPAKAGASSEREDFSTLFRAMGLPDLQI